MKRLRDLWFRCRVLRWMLANAVRDWRDELGWRDLDEYACCAGWECGCAGATRRELWAHYLDGGVDGVGPELGDDETLEDIEKCR